MWGKRLRALEEGRIMGIHGPRSQAPLPAASAREERATARAAAGEVRIQDPERDSEAMRSLFERFVEERQKTGESAVKFEGFRKLIAQQANRILSEKGGQAVSFRLETKDGKVSLKAKALK
jgi:hypothetical protein